MRGDGVNGINSTPPPDTLIRSQNGRRSAAAAASVSVLSARTGGEGI
jgi:hypothetical protein